MGFFSRNSSGGETRDQRLARTKYSGRTSASQAAQEAEARRTTGSRVTSDVRAMDQVYDSVRGTRKSAERRASARSVAGVSRWRRSVSDEWNR
jgi:hypothetical protein